MEDRTTHFIPKNLKNLYSNLFSSFKIKNLFPTAECCGIVGASGYDNVESFLYKGIEHLQHRGYDSCGIATRNEDGSLVVTKCSSVSPVTNKKFNPRECLNLLKEMAKDKHSDSKIGIAHTRWATVGGLNYKNAHPHTDYKERIALVHNGTIFNSHWLFDYLKASPLFPKIEFPESDSEAVAHLIGIEMDSGFSLEESINNAVKRLEGTWAFAVTSKLTPYLIVSRRGSPLLVGRSDDEDKIMIASEANAFGHTNIKYVSLNEDVTIKLDKTNVDNLFKEGPVFEVHNQELQSSPAPYKYWIEKEIHEQPARLSELLDDKALANTLKSIEKLPGFGKYDILLTGCGSSLHSAQIVGHILKLILVNSSKSKLKVDVVDTTEITKTSVMEYKAIPKFIIYISQSGESLDIINAFHLLKAISPDSVHISIVNDSTSFLSQITDFSISSNSGKEVSVASTKTFTGLTLAGLKFAQSLLSHESVGTDANILDSLDKSLRTLPSSIEVVLKQCDKIKEIAKRVISICDTRNSMFILGRGAYFFIGKEGALKTKEVCYIHSEAVPSGFMKHGTLAMINEEDNTPTISLIFQEDPSVPICAAEQLKARGSYVICITDNKELVEDFADDYIIIDDIGYATPLSSIVVFQLLAFYSALERGVEPDYPRGIAKTVTVM